MKFRGTLWLILIFIALGLYLALVEVPSEKKKDEEAVRSKHVLHFKVEEVQEFDLIHKDKTFKVKRDADGIRWNLVEPMAVSGEDGFINQMLVILEEVTLTRVVEEAPKDLETYGLKEPSIQVVLRFKTGKPQSLLIGSPSPLGHTTYLKTGEEERVVVSSINLGPLLPTFNDLRSKLLLDFIPNEITSVDLTYEGKRQSFQKEDGTWKLTAPLNALGDGDEVINFLSAIRRERIETFVAETPEEAKALGLDPPRIELTLKDGKRDKTWTLRIGKIYDDHSFNARRAATENIFTVSEELVQTLSRNPLSFMEKTLIALTEEEITGIESREGNQTIHVVRDPEKTGRWKSEPADPEGVDSATVNTLLLDLKEARIRGFAPVHDLKLFGLDTPKQSLTVHRKDGSQVTLHLGNPDKGGQSFFATRSSDQTVFQLDGETVRKIFRPRKDYQDKKLLKFDPEQVAGIGIQTPGRTFRLIKRDKQWRLVEPEKMDDLKPFVGKDILWTLNNLEYDTKLSASEPEEATGLDRPQLIVTLEDRDQQPLGEIKIGKSINEQPLVFGQLSGDPAQYHIKDRILGEIPTSLDRFRKKEPGSEN